MKKEKSVFVISLILLVVLPAIVYGQPDADYGDAPDPNFPSLYASGGPHHIMLTDSYVGWTSTPEPDALVPDLDADDGAPIMFAHKNPAGVWVGYLSVPITIAEGAPVMNRYLNVLIDADSDGTWCNIPGEWVVRNYPLYGPPWVFHTIYYCTGGFAFVQDYSGEHWVRVTVSNQKIHANTPNGWDGSVPSAFLIGETEDWELPWYYDDWGPGGTPGGGEVPPHDPRNPPLPQPIPECNKVGTISQVPPPTHVGHSGTFDLQIKNTGTHPIHIEEGPIPTDVNGDPIDIGLEDLHCTTIPPGGTVDAAGTWDFDNVGPNKAWCNFDVYGDPAGVWLNIANVGDYLSPTSEQPTAGAFDSCFDGDEDGDSFARIACGGTDCDDTDTNVNPGVEESVAAGNCTDGIDNDCDGDTDSADSACEEGVCTSSAAASIHGTAPVRESLLSEHLIYALAPIGILVLLLAVRRRK